MSFLLILILNLVKGNEGKSHFQTISDKIYSIFIKGILYIVKKIIKEKLNIGSQKIKLKKIH